MKSTSITMITAVALATGAAAAQSAADKQQPQTGNSVASVNPIAAQSMDKLRQSAQRLRESIQAMAQKKPGPDRDRAIDEAKQALLETQQAMMALPPELRGARTMSAADYDRSVQKLMTAADTLRESIQTMAQQQPGDARNRAIEQAQQALWDTQHAMVSAYSRGQDDARGMGAAAQSAGATAGKAGSSGQAQVAKQQGSKAAAAPAESTVLMLVPMQMASDAKLANGCWVRFYDGTNFSGATLTLAGPVNMPQMHPAGSAWREWDSAIVGPKAHVTTFDNENFHERTAKLDPGQRIPDLKDGKLGWFDEVQSARVTCG